MIDRKMTITVANRDAPEVFAALIEQMNAGKPIVMKASPLNFKMEAFIKRLSYDQPTEVISNITLWVTVIGEVDITEVPDPDPEDDIWTRCANCGAMIPAPGKPCANCA